jgi:CBS domain-containing protein
MGIIYGDGSTGEPTTVDTVMTKNPRSVTKNDSIRDAARIMRDEDTGIVPVVDELDCVVGVVTDRDLVIRVLAKGDRAQDVKVSDAMTEDVTCAHPGDPVSDVLEIMRHQQVRRVPIADEQGRLVGIVSMADVATRDPVPTSAVGRTIEEISEDRGPQRA